MLVLSSHVILLILKGKFSRSHLIGEKTGTQNLQKITQLASGGAEIEGGILPPLGLTSLATLL